MEGRWIFKRHLQNFCASLSAGPSIEHGPPDRPPPQPRRRRSCSSNAEFSLSPCLSGVRLSTGCHGRDASSVNFAIHRVPWPRVGGDTPAWSPSASRALTASPNPNTPRPRLGLVGLLLDACYSQKPYLCHQAPVQAQEHSRHCHAGLSPSHNTGSTVHSRSTHTSHSHPHQFTLCLLLLAPRHPITTARSCLFEVDAAAMDRH